MNKLLAIFTCCCLSLATITPTVSSAQDSKMDHKMMMKDGSVTMKDGKMMAMKDGKWVPMDMDMTMKDGTKVMKDGTVMKKDGKKEMLKNGDCVKPDGMVSHGKM